MSEAPQKRPLARLPSGVIINVDDILFIVRKDNSSLNQYAVFYKNAANAPYVTLEDLQTLAAYGIIQALEAPDSAANDDKKVEIAKP